MNKNFWFELKLEILYSLILWQHTYLLFGEFFFPNKKKSQNWIECDPSISEDDDDDDVFAALQFKSFTNGKQSNYFQLTVQFIPKKKERKKEIHYEKDAKFD